MATTAPPFPQTLLTRAFSPDTASTLYTERIAKRPLPIRATSPTPSARAVRRRTLTTRKESARKRNTQKPRPLSAAKKRSLELTTIPTTQAKYSLYEPIHTLWLGYIRSILNLDSTQSGAAYVSPASAGQMLASADMHGAAVSVVRSRCVSRVGLSGIVVRDTRYTFDIVTRGNVIKSVPKEQTVFGFEVPVGEGEGQKPLKFEIRGEMFQTRAGERANRKFRLHYGKDI
ncbi:hypothetical protein E8E13_000959 [Curvularia kusanoi]|uniref:Ribonuclease P protein subunit n=1 Tax=Curvularia kusanoi TaxID=90978 RepID=A0A9P4W1N3_CURKU|nr:hypothetical protein E8E13_000959 [Curvularia kusanoi]